MLLLTLLGQWALSLRFEQLAPEQQQQVTSSAAALERYQPVEGGESKRKLLWELAIRQYRGYSAAEKLFGRGFGADALLYRISDDPRLLQAYPPQSRERLSAHNFLLTDLLNGGLVQMVLGVSVWLLLAIYLIREYLPGAFEKRQPLAGSVFRIRVWDGAAQQPDVLPLWLFVRPHLLGPAVLSGAAGGIIEKS